MNIFFAFITLLFLVLECSFTGAIKNVTLNRDIDIRLFRIQDSVKSRDLKSFAKNFHTEFDARAWFERYYAEMTEDQLDNFIIRRFANVDVEDDHYVFKFSESRSTGDRYLLRSFLARTKSLPTNPYAIVELKQFGEYKRLQSIN